MHSQQNIKFNHWSLGCVKLEGQHPVKRCVLIGCTVHIEGFKLCYHLLEFMMFHVKVLATQGRQSAKVARGIFLCPNSV